MKALFLTVLIFVGIADLSAAESDFVLPSDYKQMIRSYLTKREKVAHPTFSRFLITFFAPGVAKVVRGEDAIPKNTPLWAVRIHWTPKKRFGAIYLMDVREVIVFHESQILGSLSEEDIEWTHGDPVIEKEPTPEPTKPSGARRASARLVADEAEDY